MGETRDGRPTLTREAREWICEHASEFATSDETVLRETANCVLDYEWTLGAVCLAIDEARLIVAKEDARRRRYEGASQQPQWWYQLRRVLDDAHALEYVARTVNAARVAPPEPKGTAEPLPTIGAFSPSVAAPPSRGTAETETTDR